MSLIVGFALFMSMGSVLYLRLSGWRPDGTFVLMVIGTIGVTWLGVQVHNGTTVATYTRPHVPTSPSVGCSAWACQAQTVTFWTSSPYP